MNTFIAAAHIVRKDILIEWRTKEMFAAMFLFAVLVMVVFNFTFDPGAEEQKELAAGILWVAYAFAGVLGLNRSFDQERINSAMQGLMLCPVSRSSLFLGKLLGNLIFMAVVEAISLPILAILYGVSILPALEGLVLTFALSTLGFTALGTYFAAIAVRSRSREVLLPLLLFPVAVPVLIAAAKATDHLMAGRALAVVAPWLKLLLVFDVIFVVLCFLTFDHVLEE